MKLLCSSQNEPHEVYLAAGLGNPGVAYEKSRHNMGFRVISHWAKQQNRELKRKGNAFFASRVVDKKKIDMILPLTYMNRSGDLIQEYLSLKKIPLERVLVVVDDVALPLGTIRLRKSGSHGGHNGLRSVEESLRSSFYCRLRVGIGMDRNLPLRQYVLDEFTAAEEAFIPKILNRTSDILELWIKKGIESAMAAANSRGAV